MSDEDKVLLRKLIAKVAGKRYHQGTFASVANQYPSNFARMNDEITDLHTSINKMIEEIA